MDWNAKSPTSRFLNYLSFFNAKATEIPKFQPPNWMVEFDRENNVGLFDTSGGSGYSGSDLILGSTSRSSKSASIGSSLNRDSETKEYPIESSHAPELSSVSGEPLLTLRLGKRMYFENECPESGPEYLSFSRDLMSSLSVGKKCKFNGQNLLSCCQVEGCGLDLSSAKNYHRKHRVCEIHSKSPKVVVAGWECRFCQQCSRFHDLFEFDEEKRSCRRRLSHHNARRRKYRPSDAVQSSESALTSRRRRDGKQQMNPSAYSKTDINLALQNIDNSKFPQTKEFLLKPSKYNSDIPSSLAMLSDVTCKAPEHKSNSPGVEDFLTFSDTDATQDFTCALSLLSTNPWDSYADKSISLEHSNRTTSNAEAITRAMNLRRMPLASSESWYGDLDQHVNSSMWISNSNCEEFQRFREPYESGFHQMD